MVLYRIVFLHPIYGNEIMVPGVWHSEAMAQRALRAKLKQHRDIIYKIVAR